MILAAVEPIIDKAKLKADFSAGMVTIEEVVFIKRTVTSNALSTYKVPDIYSVPKEIAIDYLQTDKENLAIFRSKAVGEPPLMYGIGAFFALRVH